MTHTPKSALAPAFIAILFILPINAIHAVDLDAGINLHNATAIEKTESGGDAELDQLDSAALWFDASSASPEGRVLALSVQGSYEYADDRAYLFNVDHLKASAWMPGAIGNDGVLELDAGRFLFADPSAFIVNHVADGVKFRMLKPGMSFELSGAYTGLILNPKSDIRMTGTDRADENDEGNIFFGPRRAFAGATLSFPNAGHYENVSVYAYGQFDLREGDDDIEIDTQYLGISTTKLHGSNLYGDFFLNAEFGQIRNPVEDTRNIAGFLLGMGLRWYREDLKSSRLAFRVLAAPPDYATDMIEGVKVASAGYLPVSETDLAVCVTPELSALGMVEVRYSLLPFADSGNAMAARFCPELSARGFFRTWTVGVDWIETDPESDSFYLGTELEANLAWRVLSDFGVGLDGAIFLPGGAAVSSMDTLWSCGIDVSVSL
ncbi:MAG TPA: hypothetical protein PK542_07185 [Treponemataceae bacterium]|nr:hypothetical protein [Treponemataceae bacterium]